MLESPIEVPNNENKEQEEEDANKTVNQSTTSSIIENEAQNQ